MLFRPFGQCAEFLTIETITDSLMPCVVSCFFFQHVSLFAGFLMVFPIFKSAKTIVWIFLCVMYIIR